MCVDNVTVPVTMMCAKSYGCSEELLKFVVPLSTIISLTGTVMYLVISTIFVIQVCCVKS